jgi:uncharacterized protein
VKRVISSARNALGGSLALLFALLLLIAGCGAEEESSAPEEDESTTTAPSETTTAPAETTQATTTASTLDESSTLTIISSEGTRTELQVAVADERDERLEGLSERTSLDENSGMLFVFNQESQMEFQMTDTEIPVSIAFINSDGIIVDIQDLQPLAQDPYPSAAPAQYALEVNQGFFAERGVGVGDVVELPGRPGLQGTLGPDEVIQAFQNAGLDVGETYPVEEDPGWDENLLPKTYAQAVRFRIPSLGGDVGGRVFVFDSEGDLAAVRNFYERLSPSVRPHLYVKGQVLLQIANELPKAEADRYGAVLKEVV